MLNRWNKLFAIATLALVLPVVANAQSSRVEGMALQGDYIKDYSSIYTYPSQVPHVGNLVYGEFGNPTFDRGMGAVLGNLWEGRYGTWAIHLRQTTPSLGQATTNSHPGVGAGGVDINSNNSHSFDLEWGKRFGGTSFGLRVNRSFQESELSSATGQTTTNGVADTNVFNRNVLGLGAGIGFEVNPSTTFEASILWQSRTFENTTNPGGINRSDDSPTTSELAARLMWQWQPNILVVPVFKWYSFDYSYKVSSGAITTTRNATQKGWQIGGAGNWTLNQNDLFVLGATVTNNTIEQDIDTFNSPSGFGPALTGAKKVSETIYPTVFTALETHVNSWLTLRFGANQGVNEKQKFEPQAAGAATDKESFSTFDMTLGMGVKVGGLMFDAIADNDFYNRFTHLSSDNAPTFGKVTATYAF